MVDDTAFAHGVLILIPCVFAAYQLMKHIGKTKLPLWTKGLILFVIWIFVEILAARLTGYLGT